MNTRDTKGMEMMTNNNLTVITGIRYMDDIRAFLRAIRAGWRLWEEDFAIVRSGGWRT